MGSAPAGIPDLGVSFIGIKVICIQTGVKSAVMLIETLGHFSGTSTFEKAVKGGSAP